MLELAGRLILASVLAWAAAAKLARPASSRAAMATFGFPTAGSQWIAWSFVVGAEATLAVGVAIGSDAAAYAAAALMLMLAATLGSALLQGKAGAPCACFGPGSTVSLPAIGRNLALAGGFAALPALPGGTLSTDEWLALGLGVTAVVGLAVAVLVLSGEGFAQRRR